MDLSDKRCGWESHLFFLPPAACMGGRSSKEGSLSPSHSRLSILGLAITCRGLSHTWAPTDQFLHGACVFLPTGREATNLAMQHQMGKTGRHNLAWARENLFLIRNPPFVHIWLSSNSFQPPEPPPPRCTLAGWREATAAMPFSFDLASVALCTNLGAAAKGKRISREPPSSSVPAPTLA